MSPTALQKVTTVFPSLVGLAVFAPPPGIVGRTIRLFLFSLWVRTLFSYTRVFLALDRDFFSTFVPSHIFDLDPWQLFPRYEPL